MKKIYQIYILFLVICHINCAYAATYFVDPKKGSDANIGEINMPFKTISRCMENLNSNDTIILREGRYYEKNIKIGKRNKSLSSVRIKAYKTEKPIIDGSILNLSDNHENWIMYNLEKSIIASQNFYDTINDIGGYYIFNNIKYSLVPYYRFCDLETSNTKLFKEKSYYVGPGVFYDKKFRKIFVRLDHSGLGSFENKYLIKKDKIIDEIKIYLTDKSYGFIIENIDNLEVDGVIFENLRTSIRVLSGSNFELKNLSFLAGKHSIILDNNIHNVLISNCVFDHYRPHWIAWSDVKLEKKPAYGMQDNAIEIRGGCNNIKIELCEFKNIFDAIDIIENSSKVKISKCYFSNIKDDAVQLGSASYEIEVDHNIIKNSYTAFSRHGSGACLRPGTKFFHHNIVESKQRILVGREDPENVLKYSMRWFDGSLEVFHSPISQHNFDNTHTDPWKIYNNTFIFGRSRNQYGAGCTLVSKECDPMIPHEVYNNVFWQIHDGEIARGANLDHGCEMYDGNIYYKSCNESKFSAFYKFIINNTIVSFETLIDLKKHIKLMYRSNKFEYNGIYTNPLLDNNYVPLTGSPCLSGGVDLPEEWPGVGASRQCRGALENYKHFHEKFMFEQISEFSH